MKLKRLHSWDITAAEARELQTRLAAKVSTIAMVPETVRYLAGLDISAGDADGMVRAAAVVLEYPSLEVAEVKFAEGKPKFPYIPGLLSFRETPALINALEQLELRPDIIYADGHGVAHPRRFGLACHIGLLTQTPTIGCAKSILVGQHEEPGPHAGAHTALIDKGEQVGTAVRTKDKVRPMYISAGHTIDLPTSIKWALACCNGRRMPEATRIADKAVRGQVIESLRGAPQAI